MLSAQHSASRKSELILIFSVISQTNSQKERYQSGKHGGPLGRAAGAKLALPASPSPDSQELGSR